MTLPESYLKDNGVLYHDVHVDVEVHLVVEKLPGLLGGGVGPTEVLDPTLDLSDDAASWVIRHFW